MNTIKLNDDQLFVLMTNLISRGEHPLEGSDVRELIKEIKAQTKKKKKKSNKVA